MIAFDMAAIKCNCDEFFTLYNVTKAGTLEMCQRKMEHTQRVADNCMYIAKHMGLNEYDCALAWTIGELHDFARFGQAVATKTFVDSERFNHARLGARLPINSQKAPSFSYGDEWLNLIVLYYLVSFCIIHT